MAELGILPHVVERVLNHVSGTFGRVAGIYNRFQYVDEMRDALNTWEVHVLGHLATQTTPEQHPVTDPAIHFADCSQRP